MNCPICHHSTDMTDFGHIRGRHIFRCKQCNHWLEEVTTLRTIPRAEHELLSSLAPVAVHH